MLTLYLKTDAHDLNLMIRIVSFTLYCRLWQEIKPHWGHQQYILCLVTKSVVIGEMILPIYSAKHHDILLE